MTLIEIYCIGAVTQALYMAVKWISHGKDKRERLSAKLDRELGTNDARIVRMMIPFIVVLMILIWPYTMIDRFLLKREKK